MGEEKPQVLKVIDHIAMVLCWPVQERPNGLVNSLQNTNSLLSALCSLFLHKAQLMLPGYDASDPVVPFSKLILFLLGVGELDQ